jgi:signal transduction histidine kinase
MIKEKALKHSIDLKLETDGVPEIILADERKFKQIMYNLLSNAIKFTPDSGRVSVAASIYEGDGENKSDDNGEISPAIQVSVSDSGIGIKQEDLSRIFKSFEQVENSSSRRFQGTGLGLAITKNLVELHGGRLWVSSEGEGKGSTFSFILPIHAATGQFESEPKIQQIIDLI